MGAAGNRSSDSKGARASEGRESDAENGLEGRLSSATGSTRTFTCMGGAPGRQRFGMEFRKWQFPPKSMESGDARAGRRYRISPPRRHSARVSARDVSRPDGTVARYEFDGDDVGGETGGTA